MAIEVLHFKPGVFAAGADLSAAQFLGVKLVADAGQVLGSSLQLQATAGAAIYGILQNKPVAGEACEVEVLGISKAIAGAAVAAGALVMVTAAGKFITATSTNRAVGQAVTAASALGDIFSVQLKDLGIQ